MKIVEVKGEMFTRIGSEPASLPFPAPTIQERSRPLLYIHGIEGDRRTSHGIGEQHKDTKTMGKLAEPSPGRSGQRIMIYRLLVAVGGLLFLIAALAIPVYYETTTLWYKVGIDKTMLKGAQFLGLFTFVLIYIQVILSTRGQFLEQLFGAATLLKLHRTNGILIVFLAAAHIFLVLAPEGLANLPIGKKFWPEMVGAALVLLIIIIAVTSHYRQQLKLDYRSWRTYHKPLGYLAILMVNIHVLFVSDSFEKTVPRLFLVSACITLVLWVTIVRWQDLRAKQKGKLRTNN